LSFFLGSSNETGGFFRFEYIWIGILLFIFIQGVGHWLTFKYQIVNEELYIQRGIFIKKKRYIQQKKVQSIDVTAGVFQRLFGLVKIKIETAGGGSEPEVHLIAISKDEASAIRAHLLKKTTEAEEQESVGGRSHRRYGQGKRLFLDFSKESSDYSCFNIKRIRLNHFSCCCFI